MGLFHKKSNVSLNDNQISSIVDGTVIDIKEVADPVFASESMGQGVAIIASKNTLVSPVDGEVVMTFPTQHALGIKTSNGIEILLHIGIDTVELNGMGFKMFVKVGDKIKRGDKLVKVDFKYIEEQGYDGTIMFVLTNTNNKEITKQLGNYKTSDVIVVVDE